MTAPENTDASPGAPAEPTVERGTYEIIRDRLVAQARQLGEKANALNARRLELFGGAEMAVVGNERIRTENNCVPRDIVGVGDRLLFGYNVFIGLKAETAVADVFSLHTFEQTGSGFAFTGVTSGSEADFLADPQFVKEFKELYRYYKDARLLQLRRTEGKLLAVFQAGASLKDVKVFRWAVDVRGDVTYIDNRGERDHTFPPSHDFAWTPTGREQHVSGPHPHVSILDEVFVDTVGGDLTVKIENNTQDGQGIWREPVEDPRQSLDDAEVLYARLGTLIVLKIRPFHEKAWRYLVFNTRTRKIDRIDAIGQACVQLPEDHGLIFPGGFYLQSGETKLFEGNVEAMEYERAVRSPNGEDVLYVFHRRDEGRTVLLPYNMIRKQVQNPLHCHGYSLFEDGKLVIFRAVSDEPTRVHAMQVWQTPFTSDEHAARKASTGSFLEKIGNADLVRGISEALSLRRTVEEQQPSLRIYEDLIGATTRMADAYHWLGHAEVGDLLQTLTQIRSTADLIVDEFEKVEALRKQAGEAVAAADAALDDLLRALGVESLTSVDAYVNALGSLRAQRGRLITLRDMRYVDRARLDALEAEVTTQFDALSARAVEFLLGAEALAPYADKIGAAVGATERAATVAECAPIAGELDRVGGGLDLLTEIVGGLEIEQATARTRILENISEVLGGLNRARGLLASRRKELLDKEGVAEFAAQFSLFSQSVAGALALADTPEKCEAQLARLMVQLEEIENRFSEFDEFLEQLATKREDVYEAFNSRRQILLDERQRRAQHAAQAADRILQGIARRSLALASTDELNGYYAADTMVAKVRELAGRLRELGDSVRADEVESRLKASREEAARALRDRQDIFEEGSAVIKLGRHRFSVNTQPLDLTMLPRDGHMQLHLAGTDFFQPLEDPAFEATRPFWNQQIVSETPEVYRSEYLAACILADAEDERSGLSLAGLRAVALAGGGLLDLVRSYAANRYDEGYERGIHDADAALILEKLLGLHATAGLLRFAPGPRARACLFWAYFPDRARRAGWERRARSLARLRTAFAASASIAAFTAELGDAVRSFLADNGLAIDPDAARIAGAYLFEEIAREPQRFVASAEAAALRDAFVAHLDQSSGYRALAEDLRELGDDLPSRHALASAWIAGFLAKGGEPGAAADAHALEEAAVLLLTERRLDRDVSSALLAATVEGLLGQHPRVEKRAMVLRLDEFLARLDHFRTTRVAGFKDFQARRDALLARERKDLRLSEYTPTVMSAFVRNRLINEVYLPLIGDNLAKQIGALGEGKRTDLMGMLLLISPPGYGKTTLMEYVANRLGFVFVKVNGPALGHGVTSLDPAEAPNATARQEVQKINFALEMGSNVMLYLDDIQHTNPELLQKFISLCDAQRRIEGVWEGETRTYDFRGKRFCVCMAGNPYTESGEKFQIPDMLANRADTYNLGDILEGRDELFALSYIENALTSNPTLAPLTSRDPKDVDALVRMARGEEIQPDQLSHPYSAVEIGEIRAVLKRMLRVQQVLLRVNQQYIESASQNDAFRTEPSFKLQGSYRNMNKLAEKVVAVMNDDELESLVEDHYAGEAQTLTTGAEHNLLKLAELRGRMTEAQARRWDEIKRGFARVQTVGGSDEDPATRVIGQLNLVSNRLEDIGRAIAAAGQDAASAPPAAENGHDARVLLERLDGIGQTIAGAIAAVGARGHDNGAGADLAPYLSKLDQTLGALAGAPRGEIVQTLAPGVYDVLERMVHTIGENLMELVRSVVRELKPAQLPADSEVLDLLDKTLKEFDVLRDLLLALEKIDTRTTTSARPRGRKAAKSVPDSAA